MRAVYRVAPQNGGVVFARPEDAQRVAQVNRALRSARTWGEFRAAMPPEEYREVLEQMEFGDDGPDDHVAFDGSTLPAVCDGDYPEWLQQGMGRLLPDDVLREFGKLQSTVLNGDTWYIPATNMEAVCSALRARGWQLAHMQELDFS